MLFVGNTALAWTDVLATLQVELQIINCVTHFSCTENCIKLYDITYKVFSTNKTGNQVYNRVNITIMWQQSILHMIVENKILKWYSVYPVQLLHQYQRFRVLSVLWFLRFIRITSGSIFVFHHGDQGSLAFDTRCIYLLACCFCACRCWRWYSI